ncbi:MAG: YeeE/YedE thiosulfate transporter family protein [Chloroflexota bacterium]
MGTLILGLITGAGFGFALQRAGFNRCNLVQRGLWLRDFTMLKLMLTAIVVGLVGSQLLAAVSPELVHFKVKSLYLWGVVGGGLIFGIGMSLAGYCPGTAMIGLGSGIGEGLLAVAGGLVGAAVFIFAFPWLKPVFFDQMDLGKLTIPGVLGLPALPTALVFAAILIGVIWGLTRLESQSTAPAPQE